MRLRRLLTWCGLLTFVNMFVLMKVKLPSPMPAFTWPTISNAQTIYLVEFLSIIIALVAIPVAFRLPRSLRWNCMGGALILMTGTFALVGNVLTGSAKLLLLMAISILSFLAFSMVWRKRDEELFKQGKEE